MKTSAKFLVLPLAIGALLVGCGDDDSSDDGAGSDSATQTEKPAEPGTDNASQQGNTEVLTLSADPSGALAYDTTELTTKPGKVTLDFTNDSPVGHDVVIEDADGNEIAATDVITGSSTSTEFEAKPGTFTFYCSVPGHEEAGMKGTLTVK